MTRMEPTKNRPFEGLFFVTVLFWQPTLPPVGRMRAEPDGHDKSWPCGVPLCPVGTRLAVSAVHRRAGETHPTKGFAFGGDPSISFDLGGMNPPKPKVLLAAKRLRGAGTVPASRVPSAAGQHPVIMRMISWSVIFIPSLPRRVTFFRVDSMPLETMPSPPRNSWPLTNM